MKWEVSIVGNESDLQELIKSFTDSELCIIERNEKYYIESNRFDNLTTSEEVSSLVTDILEMLNGAIKISLSSITPLKIGGISRIKPDGNRELFFTASATIRPRSTLGIKIDNGNGSIVVINPADKVPGWIKTGLTDQAVKKVLRLWGKINQPWVDLYRIYEVIEGDVGGLEVIVSFSGVESIIKFLVSAIHV